MIFPLLSSSASCAQFKALTVGFIGQGFVGGNLADYFESKGATVLRYSRDKKFKDNLPLLKDASLVFICVPTPTLQLDYDDHTVINCVRELLAYNKRPDLRIVIKSTILPKTFQYLDKFVLNGRKPFLCFIPEALDALKAHEDTFNPKVGHVIGLKNVKNAKDRAIAEEIFSYLPIPVNIWDGPEPLPTSFITSYITASLIKYGRNCFFVFKNVFFNILAELATSLGESAQEVNDLVASDSRINPVHTKVKDKGGRGAGGYCLPKDFAAFVELAGSISEDSPLLPALRDALTSIGTFNYRLLLLSGKDPGIMKEVLGDLYEPNYENWPGAKTTELHFKKAVGES